MNGAQRYTFDELKNQIGHELQNEQMPQKLYKSANGITRIMNAIVKTKGEGWETQVVNEDGSPMLNEQEQAKFRDALQPYLDSIIDFFGNEMSGGQYVPNMSELSGLSSDFLKTKAQQATRTNIELPGIDDIYTKVVKKIQNYNSTVNDYASKYGVLKLEKEHDMEPDVRLIPEPIALAISQGVLGLSTSAGMPIPPNITTNVLSKFKISYRTIVFTIYLVLDVARIAMGLVGPSIGRKILSLLVALLELLRGDWKKAILTSVGYFGMMPMLIGELFKVFLSMFRMLAPQIQESIIFGSLDVAKSFVIGVLLAIFQVTAPEEIRLPLIGSLEKIAQKKAEMDGTLEEIGLSARPDYLSPTWADLNNIQAVMSDEAYICSCEFEELVKNVNDAPIINFILQLLRIPVNKEFIEYKCGKEGCKPFISKVVEKAKEESDKKIESQEFPSINANKKRGGRILHSRRNRTINA